MHYVLRLIQSYLSVIPEVFIGNPVFFKTKGPAFVGMTAILIFSALCVYDAHAVIAGLTRLSSIESGFRVNLLEPSSIWFDRSNSMFLVANTNAHKVDIASPNGEFIREMGTKSDLKFPKGLATDRKRTLYVSEEGSGRVKVIKVYSDNSNEDYDLLDFSQVKAQADIKTGKVFVDPNDNLYVIDDNAQRVMVFTPDMKFKFVFGGKGAGIGKFFKIEDICVDIRGRIYVADSIGGRIQVFDQNGDYILSLGRQDPGFSYNPVSIDLDMFNRLWAIDLQKRRIMAFDLNGELLFTTQVNFFTEMSLFRPVDISFDQRNRLYLLDKGAGRINVFQINDGF